MESLARMLVDWGVASRPLDGQESGDGYLVRPLPHGLLLCVVDGVGHGPVAAATSRLALELLARSEVEDLVAALHSCHEGLKATRGAVLMLTLFDTARGLMTWLGVGNVQGVVVQGERGGGGGGLQPLIGGGGVVGRRLPPLRSGVVPLAAGDLVILATDGIDPRFVSRPVGTGPPQQIAEDILRRHRVEGDDAMVLVARHRGETP